MVRVARLLSRGVGSSTLGYPEREGEEELEEKKRRGGGVACNNWKKARRKTERVRRYV